MHLNNVNMEQADQWARTVAPQQKGSRFDSDSHLSVWSWHALPVPEWVLSGYSGFLPV